MKIISIDRTTGKVKAVLEAYDGLVGKGELAGTIDAKGTLKLQGSFHMESSNWIAHWVESYSRKRS